MSKFCPFSGLNVSQLIDFHQPSKCECDKCAFYDVDDCLIKKAMLAIIAMNRKIIRM